MTGVLFLAAMFIAPLPSIVPTEVAAAALVIVGSMMASHLRHIDISESSVALPVVLTVVIMPFSYSIANGIGVGFIAWVVLRSATGKAREISPLLWIVAAVFSSTSRAAGSSRSSAYEHTPYQQYRPARPARASGQPTGRAVRPAAPCRTADAGQALVDYGTAEPPDSKNSGSQAEALWAIAVAPERLADVMVGALNPAVTTGHHAAGRDKRS